MVYIRPYLSQSAVSQQPASQSDGRKVVSNEIYIQKVGGYIYIIYIEVSTFNTFELK